MRPVYIPFSENQFDQQRLGQAGGYIAVRANGPMFKFDSKEQYQRYLDLNKQCFKKAE